MKHVLWGNLGEVHRKLCSIDICDGMHNEINLVELFHESEVQ